MNRLTITDLKEIINGHRSYSYSEQDIGNALKSFNFLKSFSKNNLVYGVNTGFGPMADFKINKISVNSPIARGLLGKNEGDEVKITTPQGEVEYEVVSVEYL